MIEITPELARGDLEKQIEDILPKYADAFQEMGVTPQVASFLWHNQE